MTPEEEIAELKKKIEQLEQRVKHLELMPRVPKHHLPDVVGHFEKGVFIPWVNP